MSANFDAKKVVVSQQKEVIDAKDGKNSQTHNDE